MSQIDGSHVSFANYMRKLDWRRYLDKEIRREGHSYFQMITSALGSQPYPQLQDFRIRAFSNGGFERDSDADGEPDGWVIATSGSCTFSLDATNYAEGTRSAKFVTSNTAATGSARSASYMLVTPGWQWKLQLSLKVSAAGVRAKVEVEWYDSAGAVVLLEEVYNATTATDWTSVSEVLVPPSDAVTGKLILTGHIASDPNGTVWYDGVRLTERDPITRPINLVHLARRPNGQTALVAGTATTLYRFLRYDGRYVADVDTGGYIEPGHFATGYVVEHDSGNHFADGYISDRVGEWVVIGRNFSPDGRRWEAESIDGWAVFNNGVDLPVTFRVEDSEVEPIYELREMGIAYVGTIAVIKGILMCMDLGLIREAKLAENFAHDAGSDVWQNGAPNSRPFKAEAVTGYAVNLIPGANVQVAHHANLELGVDYTLEAVVRFDPNPVIGETYEIISKGNSYLFGAVTDDGINHRLVLQVIESATPILIESTVPINVSSGNTVHVAVSVSDGNSVNFYLNGELIETIVASFNSPDSTLLNVFFGSVSWTSQMYLSEFRFWQSTIRTPDEIQRYYAADVTGHAGLTAYWKFDEGTGGTTADATGNGHTGTLIGGAAWIASDSIVDSYLEMESLAAVAGGLTSAGTTATFVAEADHNFTTGDLVKVSGANDANHNGLFPVTVTSNYAFTYTMPGAAGASPDPGAPVVQRAWFGAATFDYDGMTWLEVVLASGFRAQITGVLDAVKIKVNKSIAGVVASSFSVVRDETVAVTGTVAKNGSTTVTGTSTVFRSELYPGATIRIPGGVQGYEARVVAAITSDTSLTVTAAFVGTATGQTAQRVSDYTLFSLADVFTPSMVGRTLFFQDGKQRLINGYIDPNAVTVTTFVGVDQQDYLLENVTAYDAYGPSYVDRKTYRVLWSRPGLPRRFAANVPATIQAGSRTLELAYPIRSFEVGMDLLIPGAGLSSGNLTATIERISDNRTTIRISTPALTGVEEALIAAADSIDSIVGFEDLLEDSSAILKAAPLRERLIIYKDSGFYVVTYTGNVTTPFDFGDLMESNRTPYYRNTLVSVKGKRHIYAGQDSFYSFDLTSATPEEIPILEQAKDLFFATAMLEDTESIFAADNELTKEIFIQMPESGVCLDYLQNTVSETGARYASMRTIDKPTDRITGAQENWFVMGDAQGRVLIYGRANQPQEIWGGAMAIYNRLGSDYPFILKGGLYGIPLNEVWTTGYVIELGQQGFPNTAELLVKFWGYRNTNEAPVLLGSKLLIPPKNLIPMRFKRHFIQDEIIGSGINVPCQLAARTLNFGGVRNQSRDRV